MHDILIGGSVLAAFVGGVVALFAPCCISVMLPAYFATSFRRRRALLAMTLVFALGVATVIIPIAFGASAVTRFIVGRHTEVFLAGGLLMLALGAVTLAGWKLPLPMPGMTARRDRGPAAVYALGLFSGTASACCAPVLAGVVALSGAAQSFVAASAIGVAYVFGMVAPLFIIATLWDRFDWGESRLLRGHTFHVAVGRRRLALHSTALASGLLLIAMGSLTVVLAFTGVAMPRKGWQVTLSARLQHYGSVVTSHLSGVPGWISLMVLFGLLGLLVWKAIGQVLPDDNDVLAMPEEACHQAPVPSNPQGAR